LDNIGVTEVNWSNDRGGSGTATGTTSWSVSGITLQIGTNVITVTARDAANNTGTDTLTITYSEELANLTSYKPRRWSDKIVVSNTKRTKKDSNPLYTTDKLYIDFAVINYGLGIANDFWIILYVDGKKREPFHVTQMSFYQTVTPKDIYIGTLSAGKHSIKIIADVDGNVKESNESDNEYTKEINIINR
jgi:subtilase family serine protease